MSPSVSLSSVATMLQAFSFRKKVAEKIRHLIRCLKIPRRKEKSLGVSELGRVPVGRDSSARMVREKKRRYVG